MTSMEILGIKPPAIPEPITVAKGAVGTDE